MVVRGARFACETRRLFLASQCVWVRFNANDLIMGFGAAAVGKREKADGDAFPRSSKNAKRDAAEVKSERNMHTHTYT
jgi:hypothetical protein